MEKVYFRHELERQVLMQKIMRRFASFSAGFFVGVIIFGVLL